MAPRKRVDQLNEDGDGTRGKKGPKKKITKQKAPTSIRVEVPGKTTKNTKARVVTTQKLKSNDANDSKKSKARVVTTKELCKNEIKIMLANEVVQAHFAKKPIIPDKPLEPIVKRKPGHKKLLNKETCDVKEAKPGIISAIDSDGSAFEETPETKPKKKGPKGLQRKNAASTNTVTIDNNVKDESVKRSYVTKRGLNAKTWKRTAQNTVKLVQVEHKPRKRIRKEISTKIWTRFPVISRKLVCFADT